MDKKKLGRTGLLVTQLGYGSMGLRGPRTWGKRVVSESDAEEFLHQVLDAGINFIDTAPDYGVSEQRIGKYIGSRRNEFYLATKCGCDFVQHEDHLEVKHTWNRDVLNRNVETSLKRLQTDYLDLLQFHGGDVGTLQREGLIDLVLDLKAQGIVRFIGVSSKLPEIEEHVDLGIYDTFQIPFSCLSPEHDDVIHRAASSGAGIIVRGGIAQGGPDAEIQRPQLNDVWTAARLDEVIPKEMSRAELILRYTLGHRHCHTTIVGTCNSDHLASNLAAAQAGPLPEALQTEIATRVQSTLVRNRHRS